MLLAIQHSSFQHLKPGFIVYHSVKQESTTRTNGIGRFLYLSFPCQLYDILNQELQTSNPTLHLAAPARLLTPTVALLYFGHSKHGPEHLYVFATHKGLHEYRTRTPEEPKAAQQKQSERRKDSQSQQTQTEQLEIEKENPGGEGKMDIGWASEMEEDTTSLQG